MSEEKFDLSAGMLCLDFVNTVDWHASSKPIDRLEDYADLIDFGAAAGVITTSRSELLYESAALQSRASSTALSRAIDLREAVFRLLTSTAHGEPAEPADLMILNESVNQAMGHLKVVSTADAYTWDWFGSPEAFEQISWPIARSAAELLVSEKLNRVRMCADDRGCGMLFLDTSRNKSRRWCSMESCGNRAKAKRHYQRAKRSG